MTSSDRKLFNDMSSCGLFATSQLLVKLTIINCDLTLAFGSVNFCTKIMNRIVVRRYLSSLLLKQFSISWRNISESIIRDTDNSGCGAQQPKQLQINDLYNTCSKNRKQTSLHIQVGLYKITEDTKLDYQLWRIHSNSKENDNIVNLKGQQQRSAAGS